MNLPDMKWQDWSEPPTNDAKYLFFSEEAQRAWDFLHYEGNRLNWGDALNVIIRDLALRNKPE